MTIETISRILEKTPRQIHNYIKNKHLKATKIDGIYRIERKDFEDFLNGYYKDRHKRKGVRVATCDDIERLAAFVADLQNKNLDYDSFYRKYHNIETILPPLPSFTRHKRNELIVCDNQKMKQEDIATKYRLSRRSVEEIVKKSKKEETICSY